MFKTVAQLREEIASLFDRAQAILNLAEEENRELTAEEAAEIDRINGEGGEIEKLKAALHRQERIEARQAELAAVRTGATSNRVMPQSGNAQIDAPVSERIVIPARCRYRYGSLKSFHGTKAEERAYIAGRFYLATLVGHEESRQWCHDNGIEVRNAMTGGNNERGGYLVPTEIEQAVVDLREQYGVIRQYAKVVPMGSDKKNVPVRKGGLTAYFGPVDDNGITESNKTYTNAQLVAKDLYTLVRVANSLDDDAVISVGDDITMEIAQAFAYAEDNAAFNGSGAQATGHITGILNAVKAGSVHVAAAGHDTWAELDDADILGALGKLPHYAGMQTAIFCSKQFWHQVLLRLLAAAGGNTIVSKQSGATELSYLGYPVVLTQVLPTATATATACAVVGDLRLATVFGDRRGISVGLSDQRYFENDQLAIRGKERFDFVCHSTGTASAAGAVVVLKTASS